MQETTPKVRTIFHRTYTSEYLIKRVVLTTMSSTDYEGKHITLVSSLMDIELNHAITKNITRTSLEITYRYEIDELNYSCSTKVYSRLFDSLNKAKEALEIIEAMSEWSLGTIAEMGFIKCPAHDLCFTSAGGEIYNA